MATSTTDRKFIANHGPRVSGGFFHACSASLEEGVIPYAGGELLIGQAMNVLLNSLIVCWALFLIVKAINRSQRMASVGLDQVRGRSKAEVEV